MAMRILSIDGGGIRGILPGMLLVALEKKLQDISQNPAARIADYFDLVAGTSTGAILCSAYVCPDAKGKPKFSAQEAVNFYLQDGDEIFDVGVWKTISSLGGASDEKYSAKELERVLKTAFGETKISELLRPTCFVSYSEVKDWGPFGWAKPAIDIALEGGPQMTAYYLQQIASTVKNSKYYRIQPELYGADPTLDNASRENLELLRKAGLQNAAVYDKKLTEIAKLLISNGGNFKYQDAN